MTATAQQQAATTSTTMESQRRGGAPRKVRAWSSTSSLIVRCAALRQARAPRGGCGDACSRENLWPSQVTSTRPIKKNIIETHPTPMPSGTADDKYASRHRWRRRRRAFLRLRRRRRLPEPPALATAPFALAVAAAPRRVRSAHHRSFPPFPQRSYPRVESPHLALERTAIAARHVCLRPRVERWRRARRERRAESPAAPTSSTGILQAVVGCVAFIL